MGDPSTVLMKNERPDSNSASPAAQRLRKNFN
jgi:hypothetical protein